MRQMTHEMSKNVSVSFFEALFEKVTYLCACV